MQPALKTLAPKKQNPSNTQQLAAVRCPTVCDLSYCNCRIVLSAAPKDTVRLPVAEDVVPVQRSVTE